MKSKLVTKGESRKKLFLPLGALAVAACAWAQPMAPVMQLAASEQPKLLETIKTRIWPQGKPGNGRDTEQIGP